MFDIGFSELVVIALVALVVLGPERLPRAARLAGLWVRRARAHWYAVKSEFEQELAADELRRSLHDTRAAVHEVGESLHEAQAEAKQAIANGEDDGERRD
jgi:sec-independent protein translocase protein TatB